METVKMRFIGAVSRWLVSALLVMAMVGCGSAVLKNDADGGNAGQGAGEGGDTGGAGGRGGGSVAGAAGTGAATGLGGAAGAAGGGAGHATGGVAGAGSGGTGAAGNGGAGVGPGGTGGGGAIGGAAGSCGSRDCTSVKDNDCNGVPDNQDATCTTCVVGGSLACSTGALGLCATGLETCQLAADHKSVAWGPCVQSVAKGARDCTSSNDNDCNGQADNTESTFCQCSTVNSPRACSTGLNGICQAGSQLCVVSSDKTTSAWGACTQLKAKGTETCANPGTDDDCDGVVDNVPVGPCNVGTGLGACANGGHTACSGTTQVCNAAVSGIGDATIWHTNGPAPNGSWDWDCDGVVTKQYPDSVPTGPTCTGLAMSVCGTQPQVSYALNPFACGDLGDVGSLYCIWASYIPGCTNKSGQSSGYQQGCR